MKRHMMLSTLTAQLHARINDKEFEGRSKVKKQAFTRRRKMGFAETTLFIMRGVKKSLQVALHEFLDELKREGDNYSKQAFSARRQFIKPEAFQELFNATTAKFYEMNGHQKYGKYVLLAIDGSKCDLPCSDELMEKYGAQESSGGQVQCLVSCMYDVLNGTVVDATLSAHDANEREEAKKHIERVKDMVKDPAILLMDRGYPAADLIKCLENAEQKYVIRCVKEFTRGMKLDGADRTIVHAFCKSKVEAKLRVIQLTLKSGSEEILITNLLDSEFTVEDLCALYHKRWGIEEEYKNLKVKLGIENFSGLTEIAVLQDFYATLTLCNLAAAAVADERDEVDSRHNNKGNEYLYKQNINVTLAALKDNFVKMVLCESDRKRKKMLANIEARLAASVVSVRDDRSFDHTVKHKSRRFCPNNRPI
ncbi:MAG: IS4 family transposase [Citrobacter sp.]